LDVKGTKFITDSQRQWRV